MNTSFTFSLNLAMSVMFVTAMLPPLNTPMCENLSRCAGAMLRVCMPPMERPAIARCGWSASVRKLASM
jgi:hypothetical protein